MQQRLTPTMLRRYSCLILLTGWLCILSACGQSQPAVPGRSAAYDQLLRTLYHGRVPTIQPAVLAQLLQQPQPDVVLLDTRTPAEYKVSHLPGARFVNFDTYQTADFAALPRNRQVVVYCSVGARSEKVAERLQALGFSEVRNLYGGLFEWVNEGYPVYNAQGRTENVHPYSALWSGWLQRGQPVYE